MKYKILAAAILSIAFLPTQKSEAGVINASNDFRTSAGGGGVLVVDSDSTTTTLGLVDSNPSDLISNVLVSVNVSKSGSAIDTNGVPTGGGFTFNSETVLRLTSPEGTTVNLVNQGTYGGQNTFVDNVQLNFNDMAVLPVGGVDLFLGDIVPGTFQPVGSLASLIGEPATGTWTLFLQDTVGGDPLSVNDWSLTVTTTSTVPEPASLAIFGTIFLIANGRRRSL